MGITESGYRLNRSVIHMTTAFLWADRSTCLRKAVGAVITSSDRTRVLAVGYNGAAKGLGNDFCSNIQNECGCIHAEANAIAKVDSTIRAKVLFCTTCPCWRCASLIAQSNIRKVYYVDPYRNDKGLEILIKCKVDVEQMIGLRIKDVVGFLEGKSLR